MHIPKEWCLNMAQRESGEEIGAGAPDHPLRKIKPDDCPHCAPDHKYYGPGWVYHGINGPISPCPLCNNDGAVQRQF